MVQNEAIQNLVPLPVEYNQSNESRKLNRLDQQERIAVLIIDKKKIKDRKKAHDF
jgi:hypothetical protein